MPTLPRRGCMIAGRVGRRRVRRLRWSIKRAKEKKEAPPAGHLICEAVYRFCLVNSPTLQN